MARVVENDENVKILQPSFEEQVSIAPSWQAESG